MGTGTTTTDKCRIGSNNFGDLLNRWTNNPDVDFQRKVCSGDTTVGLNRQIDEWSNPSKADLATVSIGGNDVFFSDLVWYCVITPNNARLGSTNRRLCLETEAKARQLLDDQGDDGLKAKFKSAYKKILAKSGRDDFHIYVTSYVGFFNHDDPDCDKTTFQYTNPRYDPPSDWPANRIVLLKTDLRHELNDLVGRLNEVIGAAADETNSENGREQVHFVFVNPRYDSHRWCEVGDFHEPDSSRADTWFFLSAWPDIPMEAGDASVDDAAEEQQEIQAVVDSGKIELPDAASCNDNLGSDPDPWDRWLCRAAEEISERPDGPLAEYLTLANDAVAQGNVSAEEISWWVPTRQIKTFHPRSRGMVAYRDAIIESINSVQTAEAGTCKLQIKEIWTCEDLYNNLYAELTVESPSGDVLYQTPGSTSSPGVPINDPEGLHLKEDGMSEELVVIGEHTNDYIQFYYGDTAWRSTDTEGAAACTMVGDDWPQEGPGDCPASAVVIPRSEISSAITRAEKSEKA
ncbi:hypothetical protein AK830_g4814 [Neonectria ditissima]|uniref:SGNH hydrolase-type esterase domain-containing protein n=1 Tax=Neonectria ditissima TaxID=78410 RepID=A0A0P7BFF8_9HYPO|nr:hypothetical protein AK830_g4814 [Neonectria ditissima]